LAELEDEDAEALWGYLCKQWDRENDVDTNPGRQLLRYNFFMLQADVLPNMAFSSTRKRLVHSHECVKAASALETNAIDLQQEGNPTYDVSSHDDNRSEL
jgi:hypothetical protein